MALSVEELLVELVEELEDELGQTPERIIVEPLGKAEVNARVGLRGETHPRTYWTSRRDDS
jgi:hypothetical protein